MSGSEPAEMSDREPAGEPEPADAAGTAPADGMPVPEAVPAESSEGSEVTEVYETADSSGLSGTAEAMEAAGAAETVGTAEASGPVDAWASPGGARQADPAAPTMAVPVPQPQPQPQYQAPAADPQQYPGQAPAPQYPAGPYPQPGQPAGYPQPGQPGYGYMQPYQYTPSPEEVQAALEAKRKRKRKLWTWTAVVAVVAVVGAGVVVIESGRHGNSVVSAVTCTPAKLSSCLIKPPQGAETLSDAPKWDQAAAPSMGAVGTNITGDAKSMADQTSIIVATDGENAVAHTDWNAVDGNDLDMVLLKFDTIRGAQSWNATRNGEILAAYPGPSVAVSGDSAEKAHASAKADAKGNYHAAYSVAVGNMVLNLSYSSPNKFDPADLQNWAGTELTSLWSAPKPAADSADSSNGTQTLSCGSLTACLPARPSGFEPWLAPPSGWIRSSTMTSKQYVKYFWESKDQAKVLDNFSTYDVTGIAHTAWANGSADQQADIYLVQTLTEAGAKELSDDNFGEPNWGKGYSGVSYSVPGQPGVQAWYQNKKDPNGFNDIYFTAVIGNTIAEGWIYIHGSLNKTLINKWVAATVKKLNSSSAQKPVGMPSLATTPVKVPAQGSCAASGECLMALPSGAKDTTSGSALSATKAVSAQEYAVGNESDFNQQYTSWLGADGFQSAEHRSWTSSDGAKADAVLLKFGSAAQAQASAMLEYGLGTQDGRVCTVSSVSNVLCFAAQVSAADYYQMETVTVLAWKGDYEVRVNVTVSNEAQVAQAYAWAEQQLSMLPAS